MRIIGGEARGRRLFTPRGDDTRPTADRTRESLFNIIASRVPGARVLDLFAGTGAMALEAMSRGAERALLCDISKAASRVIERNCALVLGDDWRARVTLMTCDFRAALARAVYAPYDIAFIDPPYRMEGAYTLALSMLADGALLSRGGVALVERLSGADIVLPDAFELSSTRAYRDTAVDFVCWRDGQ